MDAPPLSPSMPLIKLPDQKERQIKSLPSREVKNVANDVKTAANNSEVQRKGKIKQ